MPRPCAYSTPDRRWFCAAVALAALSCARIEFNGDSSSGGSTATTGGAGAGGMTAGGAPAGGEGGAGGDGGAPTGGGPEGGGGAAPCPGVPETCDGTDEDCNGIADDPLGGSGDFCGCTWLTYNTTLYAACPTMGADIDTLACPLGMELVVLQDSAEQLALIPLLPPTIGAAAYLGLRQPPASPDPTAAWQWQIRQGMVPVWGTGEPNDYVASEPAAIENDEEQCGALYRPTPSSAHLIDYGCSGAAQFLCEASADSCVQGGTCLLAEGCKGTFDCQQPPDSQCVATSSAELCNGLDDNCDGSVDEGATCGCVAVIDPGTLRVYKHCAQNVAYGNIHCGPGFRPAILQSAAEILFAEQNLVVPAATGHWIGLYQPKTAITVNGGWTHLDGTALTLPFWEATQPTDGDGAENQAENCARLDVDGSFDRPCADVIPYICEEI